MQPSHIHVLSQRRQNGCSHVLIGIQKKILDSRFRTAVPGGGQEGLQTVLGKHRQGSQLNLLYLSHKVGKRHMGV